MMMSSYARKDDKITAHYPAAGEAKSRKASEKRLVEDAATQKGIRLQNYRTGVDRRSP
jgi:hypothetical protein